MQYPLGFLPQGIAAAVQQMVGQFQHHIPHIVHRHIRGNGTHHNGKAAVIIHFHTAVLQKFLVGQQGLLFLGGKVDLHGDKQHLRRHAAVILGELLKQDALMCGVLINQTKLIVALGDDVGFEYLPHHAQRQAGGCRGKGRLLRRDVRLGSWVIVGDGQCAQAGGRFFLFRQFR